MELLLWLLCTHCSDRTVAEPAWLRHEREKGLMRAVNIGQDRICSLFRRFDVDIHRIYRVCTLCTKLIALTELTCQNVYLLWLTIWQSVLTLVNSDIVNCMPICTCSSQSVLTLVNSDAILPLAICSPSSHQLGPQLISCSFEHLRAPCKPLFEENI